jgi:hypothetical protein
LENGTDFLEVEAGSEDLGGYLHDGDYDGDGVEAEGDTLMALLTRIRYELRLIKE